jgi:hypothetical protein
VYTITSQQSFKARIDGNKLIVEAADSRVEKYPMTLSTTVNLKIDVNVEIFPGDNLA